MATWETKDDFGRKSAAAPTPHQRQGEQCGDGSTSSNGTPNGVTGLSGQAYPAQAGHSCAMATDGSVTCWGSRAFGAMGNGNPITGTQPSPAPVSNFP